MNPDDVITMISQHAWVPLAALVVNLLLRLLKDDTTLPTIPTRYRFWAAFALGAASGVLDHVMGGTPWRTALVGGLVSAALAVLAQNGIVDSIFAGRELPLPRKIMIPGMPPSPGKLPSLPPEKAQEEATKPGGEPPAVPPG